jgi:DNA-binding beta-propeller fold protein YncE
MARRTELAMRPSLLWLAGALAGAAVWIVIGSGGIAGHALRGLLRTHPLPTGAAQLVSIEPLPEMDGEQCAWMPASAPASAAAASWQSPGSARSGEPASGPLSPADAAKRAPLRTIHDPFPSFSSVAVDSKHDEIVLTDENLFQILVYDRKTNTPPKATMSEPRRVIGGTKTKIEFQCAVYIDPESGDIYAVNNDTVDTLAIFSRNAKGNVSPDRELHTPHGTFGITMDEDRKEMYLTVQHANALVVYDKMAKGEDKPLRMLQGNSTRLADPHGIALDKKDGVMFITNHGSLREFPKGAVAGEDGTNMPTRDAVPGSGHMVPSSITVYARDAKGDTPPLRVITGPNTQLDWPTGLAVDEERGELYVANDMGDSILVFRTDAEGDVAPIRVLRGPKTGMKNPTGVYLDRKEQELVVANFGNHTATTYKLPAGGDTAPVRKLRSGPPDTPALMIGNPGSVAYDSKREEILVPN